MFLYVRWQFVGNIWSLLHKTNTFDGDDGDGDDDDNGNDNGEDENDDDDDDNNDDDDVLAVVKTIKKTNMKR